MERPPLFMNGQNQQPKYKISLGAEKMTNG
jgi:hypothetical protein